MTRRRACKRPHGAPSLHGPAGLRVAPARSCDLDPEKLALHDAQSLIARQHGFVSWKALKDEVEVRALSFAAAVDEFIRCATGSVPQRAERLLALHPAIASASFHTALVLAALYGNHDIALRLVARGAKDELSRLEQFIAACARGDAAGAHARLEAEPSLRAELRPEHHRMLHRPAESGNAAVLATMLSCGFDPDARDKDRVTPLHRAAMAGHVAAVRVLLASGADVHAMDDMFSATPLVWAVEGRGHPQGDADHVGVARLLIAAGSSVEWQPPEGAPGPERTLEGLLDLRRAAGDAG